MDCTEEGGRGRGCDLCGVKLVLLDKLAGYMVYLREHRASIHAADVVCAIVPDHELCNVVGVLRVVALDVGQDVVEHGLEGWVQRRVGLHLNLVELVPDLGGGGGGRGESARAGVGGGPRQLSIEV